MKNRFTPKRVRLFSDITEFSHWFNIEIFLVSKDYEKAFNSLEHGLLSSDMRKFVFGKKFHHMDRNFIKRSILMC